MRLGTEYSDSRIAEQCNSSREVVVRWRSAEDARAPTLTSLLLADDVLFDALLSELLAARKRLGHGKRVLADGDVAERSERLTAALKQAAAANDVLIAAVEEARRSR